MIEFETLIIVTAITLDVIGHVIFFKLLLRRERVQMRLEHRLNEYNFHRRFEQ